MFFIYNKWQIEQVALISPYRISCRLVHLFSYWMARKQLSPHWTEEGDGGKLVIEHIFPIYDPDT